MSFQIVAVDPSPFAPLSSLSDAELQRRGARRIVADADFGYPCRASLADAATGEELLLLPYAHHTADTPFRASGPIFVRRDAARRILPAADVPLCVRQRLMSLRAYDADGMMVESQVTAGELVAGELTRLFERSAVAEVHLHYAKPGCYACRAIRARVGG